MKLFTYESDDTFKPNDDQKVELVSQIVENYKNWDEDRSPQREQYEKIEESLYIDITQDNVQNNESILLPQIYEQYQTLSSNITKSNFQNEDMMFNVEGEDEESQQTATMQKANIKNALKKMNFTKEVDRALHFWLTKGEMISFTYWETVIEQVRRKVDVPQPIIDPISGMELGTQVVKQIQKVPRIKYDGVKVIAIDPLHFVFDKNEILNWDSCNKIYYDLVHPYDVINNETYNLLSDDDKEYLEGIMSSPEDLQEDEEFTETQSGVRGNQVTFLECWGDIKLLDGTVLKNYVVTVIADRFIARCEPNPYIRNPFTMSQWMPDPDTKRGRSPLLVAIPINQVSSKILNTQLRGLALSLNPPILAPNGAFTQNRIPLSPGKIVEYNDMFNQANQIQPYNFKDCLMGFDFLPFFETKIEASTGAFKYMIGAQDNRARTATETSATVTGQNVRLSMTIRKLNDEWTVPTIENIAALQANMNFDDEQINLGKQGGTPQFGTITPEVRQGNYKYTYGDSQSAVEMEAKMQKITNLIASFAGKANINWEGLVKMIFNKLNIEDTEQFLTPDPIDQAIQQLSPKPLPQEYITQLKQQFVQSGGLQQVLQMMQQPQGEANGQPNGNSNVSGQSSKEMAPQNAPPMAQQGVPSSSIPSQG